MAVVSCEEYSTDKEMDPNVVCQKKDVRGLRAKVEHLYLKRQHVGPVQVRFCSGHGCQPSQKAIPNVRFWGAIASCSTDLAQSWEFVFSA